MTMCEPEWDSADGDPTTWEQLARDAVSDLRRYANERVTMRQTFNLTTLRRDVLNRMFESGRPLSIQEAMNGRANIMPTLVRFGWAQYQHTPPRGYIITDDGMRVIGFETVEAE